jgi:hypothetical protein
MELHNFPMVNQLVNYNTTTGAPANNALYDCVPSSIAAGLDYLTGKTFDPDTMKDWAYGPDYANSGTAATAFISYCAQQGVALYAIDADNDNATIMLAHKMIQKGLPVIFTQQDDYASDPGYTHVCVWYSEISGFLTAMDPFGGFPLTYDDATWSSRLRANELWLMEKMMPIPHGWSDNATTNVLTCPNGKIAVHGFRQHILDAPTWDGNDALLENEVAVDNIELHTTRGKGARQLTVNHMLVWTQAMGVKESSLGSEVQACYNKIADLQKQLASKK